VIHKLFTLMLLASASAGSTAAAADSSSVSVSPLTEQIYLLSVDEGSYTTNTLAFVGDDGLLLVDTQAEEYAEDLKKAVESFGRGVPAYIVNTHRHVEHIGGNALFGPGPVIIAHHLVPEKLRTGIFLFDEYPPEAYPDLVVYDSLRLFFNGDTIRLVDISGSHDDNEIMVHFMNNKVVHLSSITNGFNFPSVDSDGDIFQFDELVEKAMRLLPEDVVIVSGHNAPGRYDQLQPYHDMIVKTTAIVRQGLAEGKDVAQMQTEKVLDEFKDYAGSYVSEDQWIKYLARALEPDSVRPSRNIYTSLYQTYKADGAQAAADLFVDLKESQTTEYKINEYQLAVVGYRLSVKAKHADAIPFFEGSLREYPEGAYNALSAYYLATCHHELGDDGQAVVYCHKALELNPEYEDARQLLEELE